MVSNGGNTDATSGSTSLPVLQNNTSLSYRLRLTNFSPEF